VNQEILIKEDEDISPFIRGKIRIIQKREGYRFNIDSLLLVDFLNIKSSGKIIDIGTGSGIMPILISLKYKNLKLYALEVQEDLFDIAKRNFQINNVNVQVALGNVKDVKKIYNHQYFDYVVINPPYFKEGNYKNIQEKIARSEALAKLEDFIYGSWYLLKNKGKIYLINIIERFSETVSLLKKYNIQPKRYRFIHPSINEKATHFLVEASKNAKEGGEIVEAPLIIYENPRVEFIRKWILKLNEKVGREK